MRPAANLKPVTYRCPFCDERLPALMEHMLVVPEGDTRRRRHAHTECVLAEKRAGRLPSRDEWLETQPRQAGWFSRLLAKRRARLRKRRDAGARGPASSWLDRRSGP